MMRKIVRYLLTTVTGVLAVLTMYRIDLAYNENGVYFHEGVTYDVDALLVYLVMTGFSLAITIGIAFLWKPVNINPKGQSRALPPTHR